MSRLRNIQLVVALLVSMAMLMAGPVVARASKADKIRLLALKGFGGADRFESLMSIMARGSVKDMDMGRTGTYLHYALSTDMLRLDMVFGGLTVSRALSGLRSYYSDGGGSLTEVREEKKHRVYFEYKSLALPFVLIDRQQEPEYSGMGISGGQRYEKLTLYDPAGPALVLYIDSSNGHVLRTEMDSGYGLPGKFVMEFSDYRAEAGMEFPHGIREYIGGRLVMEIVIETYSFDVDVSPLLFQP